MKFMYNYIPHSVDKSVRNSTIKRKVNVKNNPGTASDCFSSIDQNWAKGIEPQSIPNFIGYDTKVGPITIITEDDDHISKISFGNNCLDGEKTPYIKKAYMQISEYLAGKRKTFDLNLKFCGTEFQKSVWNALLKIPYGETRSYKDIAKAIGSPYAYRAVGIACNRNPICIVIPCHRVIGSCGNLTGYAGGLDIKKQLLEMEQGSVIMQ